MKTQNFKPILFSTEMVQAILAGIKTQTRRVCKISPEANIMGFYVKRRLWDSTIEENPNPIGHIAKFNWGEVKSKYTEGDILWVRETFAKPPITAFGVPYIHKAGFDRTICGWKPSIHMPKEAARIFLKVTNVRVERLQDISQEDAEAEGVKIDDDGLECWDYLKNKWGADFSPEDSFQSLWQSINAKKHPWESNPWVWVYEFERIEKPENF